MLGELNLPSVDPLPLAIVVLEDVVTTGRSAMLAVERLRAVGYQVERIIALVDREQGGAEFYLSKRLKFQSIFSISDIQNYVSKNKKIENK